MSNTTRYTDKLTPMSGEFHLVGRDKSGNIVFDFTEHNMIVVGAKNSLARLFSNPVQDAKVVTKIGGGTAGDGPSPDDVALTGSYSMNIEGYTYPASGQVTFNWTLGYGEANGMEIKEFGLLTTDGTLFARKTRGLIVKDEDLSLQGSWTIIF